MLSQSNLWCKNMSAVARGWGQVWEVNEWHIGLSAMMGRFCSFVVVLNTGLYTFTTAQQHIHVQRLHINDCMKPLHGGVWWRGLCNSVKLWAMLCRATQDWWVIVKTSDKTWSTREGKDKPLQHSYLENLMNSMKRQKEENSSLPHFIVFLYFHCSFKKAFLSLLAILWNSTLRWVYFSLSPLPLILFFTQAICKSLLRQPLCLGFFHFGMVLVTASCIVLRTSVHSSSVSVYQT